MAQHLRALCQLRPGGAQLSFWRTRSGLEVDFIMYGPNLFLAIEVKRSMAPKAGRGFYAACEDLTPTRRFVVYPGDDRWPLADGVEVIGLDALCREVGAASAH